MSSSIGTLTYWTHLHVILMCLDKLQYNLCWSQLLLSTESSLHAGITGPRDRCLLARGWESAACSWVRLQWWTPSGDNVPLPWQQGAPGPSSLMRGRGIGKSCGTGVARSKLLAGWGIPAQPGAHC